MTLKPSQPRAIITGASRGIGKATALTFARSGIDLALVSRSQDELETVSKEARALGVNAKAYPLDLSRIEDIKTKMEAIVADFGGVDILINNAGIGYTNTLTDTSLADWQKVLDINLSSVFQCVMGVLPQMRQQGEGTIINVTSIAASTPFAGWGAYCVSKAGLVAFSRVLGEEEKSNGIRVMNICPGAVNSSIWDTETVSADFDRSVMLSPEIVAQSILHAALLPATAVIENLTVMPSAGTL
jgi:short-subunit dehydrogenase